MILILLLRTRRTILSPLPPGPHSFLFSLFLPESEVNVQWPVTILLSVKLVISLEAFKQCRDSRHSTALAARTGHGPYLKAKNRTSHVNKVSRR